MASVKHRIHALEIGTLWEEGPVACLYTCQRIVFLCVCAIMADIHTCQYCINILMVHRATIVISRRKY